MDSARVSRYCVISAPSFMFIKTPLIKQVENVLISGIAIMCESESVCTKNAIAPTIITAQKYLAELSLKPSAK